MLGSSAVRRQKEVSDIFEKNEIFTLGYIFEAALSFASGLEALNPLVSELQKKQVTCSVNRSIKNPNLWRQKEATDHMLLSVFVHSVVCTYIFLSSYFDEKMTLKKMMSVASFCLRISLLFYPEITKTKRSNCTYQILNHITTCRLLLFVFVFQDDYLSILLRQKEVCHLVLLENLTYSCFFLSS